MPLLFEKYVPWYKIFIYKIRLNEIMVSLNLVKKSCVQWKKILFTLLIAIVKLWIIIFFKIFISFTDFLNY